MPSRKSNQFNNLVTWRNLASVGKEMKEKYFKNQIEKIFSMDIPPYEKYLKIKNKPNLTPQDLQRIIKWLPTPSMYPEIKDKWDEVINHRDRLAAKLPKVLT